MLNPANPVREYVTLNRPTTLTVTQLARERVRKARSELDDFRHGYELQIADCRQRIEQNESAIRELLELQNMLGDRLEPEDKLKLQRLLPAGDRLRKELDFHLDWESRQRKNFELSRREGDLQRAYHSGLVILYKDLARRVARLKSEGDDIYAISEIFEAAAEAGELIREGFAEFGYFEIPDFRGLKLEKLCAKRPDGSTWPALPDWGALIEHGMDVLKQKSPVVTEEDPSLDELIGRLGVICGRFETVFTCMFSNLRRASQLQIPEQHQIHRQLFEKALALSDYPKVLIGEIDEMSRAIAKRLCELNDAERARTLAEIDVIFDRCRISRLAVH